MTTKRKKNLLQLASHDLKTAKCFCQASLYLAISLFGYLFYVTKCDISLYYKIIPWFLWFGNTAFILTGKYKLHVSENTELGIDI